VTPPPLRCPHCSAEFDFAGWQKAASCPACGRRVRFDEAVAAAAAAGATATDAEAASVPEDAGRASSALPPANVMNAPPPAASAGGGSAGADRYLLGRPRRWTRAWSVVVLVWVVAACGLAVARVEAGHGAVLTPRDRGAIAAVQAAPLESGTTYGDAMRKVEKQLGVSPDSARWYVQDRAWDETLSVHRVLGQDDLSWTVAYGGRVGADAGTAGILKELMSAGTGQPGGLPSLPPIPSL
jgi:hypothetical protein